MTQPKPLILIILDGWGYRAETKANAIALARKPVYDRLLREYPNTLIQTSGPFVGLPEGQMGNSEVGHLNIGAGRIVHMDSTRIELMIQNGEFFQHPVLLKAMKNARTGGRQLHLFGLLSDGGVHSYQTHLHALVKDGEAKSGRARFRARLHGRPRHSAHQRCRLPRATAEGNARVQHGKDCDRQRPLLCDGPRPPVGADWRRRITQWCLARLRAGSTPTRCRA